MCPLVLVISAAEFAYIESLNFRRMGYSTKMNPISIGGLMEGWYVAKVKPSKETSLISFLTLWGLEVFFPTIIQPSRTGPRMKPLFPTYLFCHLETESRI